MRSALRLRVELLSALACLATACMPAQYRQPGLPHEQLALVKVEQRAVVRTVDGEEPFVVNEYDEKKPLRKFWVAPSCHEILVHYQEDYVREEGGIFILAWGLAPPVVAMGVTIGAANAQVTTYRTDEPIRFQIPARPGMKYWITSTFTGDVFMPRVAVLDETGERVDVILPNEPCTSKDPGTGSTEPVP